MGSVLSGSLLELWYGFISFVPGLLLAVILFIIGWIVGSVVGKAIAQVITAHKVVHHYRILNGIIANRWTYTSQ